MSPKLALIAAALAAPIIATTLAGAATNLVTNGTFDNSIGGWSKGQNQAGAIAHQSDHIAVTNLAADPDHEVMVWAQQCIPVDPAGFTYKLRADTFVPSGQAVAGYAQLGINWYPNTDCSGAFLQGHLSVHNPQEDAWAPFQVMDPGPAAAHSARILLISGKKKPSPGDVPGSPYVALFDNVTFSRDLPPEPEPEPDVPGYTGPEIPQGPFDIFIPGPLGQGPKSEPTAQPSGPSNPEPEQPQQPANPGQPEQPKADEPASQPETPAAVADATPLPPSTGTGVASNPNTTPLVAIATALIAVATATFAFATRRSR